MLMAADKQPEQRRRRQCRVECRPHCPEHGDTMSAGSSQHLLTYYYCTVDGCDHSAKAARVYNPVKDAER